jgi:hypothetical protein
VLISCITSCGTFDFCRKGMYYLAATEAAKRWFFGARVPMPA